MERIAETYAARFATPFAVIGIGTCAGKLVRGSNPIPLIVPCHRVLAAYGKVSGFMHSRDSVPLSIERWLLAHEGR